MWLISMLSGDVTAVKHEVELWFIRVQVSEFPFLQYTIRVPVHLADHAHVRL
jgi:hypothetical protein